MRKVIKDKRFIFFTSIILLTYFFICQIVLITMIGKENALAIIIGAFTVVVGLSGAIVAYFIAIAQINKQDSNRVIDLKLKNYKVISLCLYNIMSELTDLRKEIYLGYEEGRHNEISKQMFLVLRESKAKCIEENMSTIRESRVYFKLMGLDSTQVLDSLEWDVTGFVFIEKHNFERPETYGDLMDMLSTNLKNILALKKKIDNEIESILLK